MSTVADTTSDQSNKAAPQPKLRKSLNAGQSRTAALLVAPTLALLGIVIVFPLVKAIIMSFQKDQGLDKSTGQFVSGGNAGLDNYKHWLAQQCGSVKCPPGTLGAQFYDALWVTIFFTVTTVVIEVILGLWFAMIMNRTFKGRGLVRAAILVPWAIPTAVTAKLWFFILAFDGIANHLLGLVGIKPLLWTGDKWPARFAIVIADVWKTTPFMALLILAGLQIIGADVYEAAKIDGASKWQTFTRITIPMIKVPLMVAVLFRTLDVLRIYDLPAILTQGGGGSGHATTSLSILVINQIRSGFNSASALSTIVFLIIAFTAFLFVKYGGADVVKRPPRNPTPKSKRRGRKGGPSDTADANVAGSIAGGVGGQAR
jgi:ABC-type sugar transport system permease subunit